MRVRERESQRERERESPRVSEKERVRVREGEKVRGSHREIEIKIDRWRERESERGSEGERESQRDREGGMKRVHAAAGISSCGGAYSMRARTHINRTRARAPNA